MSVIFFILLSEVTNQLLLFIILVSEVTNQLLLVIILSHVLRRHHYKSKGYNTHTFEPLTNEFN